MDVLFPVGGSQANLECVIAARKRLDGQCGIKNIKISSKNTTEPESSSGLKPGLKRDLKLGSCWNLALTALIFCPRE
ncbi:MAG: hypothetical protein HQL07_17950 [Nitrospirae bacterium]|nr:hypothetical protein [Magnetococcales bacterium]